MPHSTSLTITKGLMSIPHGLAILSTTFRIIDRYRTHRLWWDEFWVFLALILDIPFAVALWLRPYTGSTTLPLESRITICWLGLLLFPSVLWFARISLATSVMRILPQWSTMRRAVFAVACAFGSMWIALVGLRSWVCGHDSSWHSSPVVQCYLGHRIGILTLCTDIIADCLLIAIPLRILWHTRLASNVRRLILMIFTSSVLTSLSSIVYVTFVFGAERWGPRFGIMVSITAHLEATVSLLVCNLLVVVTFFYRVFHHGEDIETYEYESTKYTPDPGVVGMQDTAASTSVVFTQVLGVHTQDIPFTGEDSLLGRKEEQKLDVSEQTPSNL